MVPSCVKGRSIEKMKLNRGLKSPVILGWLFIVIPNSGKGPCFSTSSLDMALLMEQIWLKEDDCIRSRKFQKQPIFVACLSSVKGVWTAYQSIHNSHKGNS